MALSTKSKTFHNRGNTFIKLVNNTLLIINNNTLDKDTFAIKVCNNFYMELGRPLQDFKDALIEANIPIVFERITKIYDYTHYNIVRMETDNVDDIILGTVICRDGIIEKITCDSRYKYREDFNKYDSIGLLWRGGSFKYQGTSDKNRAEAKKITLTLMSLSLNSTDNSIDDIFLFSPLEMGSIELLDNVRRQIRKDNIETEFESGNLEEAYELVEEELQSEEVTFNFSDSTYTLTNPGDNYELTELFDTYILNESNNRERDVDTIGNIEISTTYSTVKIEVNLKDIENDREYKFTFILNESSGMYELISITLV